LAAPWKRRPGRATSAPESNTCPPPAASVPLAPMTPPTRSPTRKSAPPPTPSTSTSTSRASWTPMPRPTAALMS